MNSRSPVCHRKEKGRWGWGGEGRGSGHLSSEIPRLKVVSVLVRNLRMCNYSKPQRLPFLNCSARILLTLEALWGCFHMREVFLNNFPDMSGLSKFSINFSQSSFPACCFSSFGAHLFKCSFDNKNLLFVSASLYVLYNWSEQWYSMWSWHFLTPLPIRCKISPVSGVLTF